MFAENEEMKNKFGRTSRKIIIEKYAIDKLLNEHSHLYSSLIEEMEGYRWAIH